LIEIDKNHHKLTNEVSEVLIIGYDNQKAPKVSKGENKGKILTNYNIVTYIKNIGRYYGSKLKEKHDIIEADNIIIILQNDHHGILGIKKL
jgi:hypothetical protein